MCASLEQRAMLGIRAVGHNHPPREHQEAYLVIGLEAIIPLIVIRQGRGDILGGLVQALVALLGQTSVTSSVILPNLCPERLKGCHCNIPLVLFACTGFDSSPNVAREGNSMPSIISIKEATPTGRKAIAGICKTSHNSPPTKGPTKATAYVSETVMPVRRATSWGSASSGGSAIPSVKTKAELPPSSAAHRGSRTGGVNSHPVIERPQIRPAIIKGTRRPASRCANSVTPRLTGSCAAFRIASVGDVNAL